MFEFTREFILNDIKNVKMQGDVLCVPKMINIEKSKVHSVHYAPYHPAVNEVVSIPAASLGEGGALTITIGQEGRVISLVSSRDAENQKDYIFNGTPADWARQFARQQAMEDMDRLIDIDFTNGLTVKALDCYTRILKVTLVADKVEDGKVVGEEVKEWSRKVYWQNKALGIVEPQKLNATLVPGTEGMGTVARLQKNNRVLTAANITPYGFDRDERPVPGGKYDQFTIQYVSERRHQTAGVFGAIDHSLVTLVFFVPAELKNEGGKDFKSLVGALVDGNICTVGYLMEVPAADVEAVEAGTNTKELLPGEQSKAAKDVAEFEPVVEAKEEIVSSKKHSAKVSE